MHDLCTLVFEFDLQNTIYSDALAVSKFMGTVYQSLVPDDQELLVLLDETNLHWFAKVAEQKVDSAVPMSRDHAELDKAELSQ